MLMRYKKKKKKFKKKLGFKLRSLYLLLLEFCYWKQHYEYTVIRRNSELSHSKARHIKIMFTNWFLDVLISTTL